MTLLKQQKINRAVVKTLYDDFFRQMFQDVANVVDRTSSVGKNLTSIVSDIQACSVFIPDIQTVSDAFVDETNVQSLPLIIVDEDADIIVSDVLSRVDSKSHNMLYMYIWLIVSSAYVWKHPDLLPVFRKIATSDSEDVSGVDDEVFVKYMSLFIDSRTAYNNSKQEELNSVFESTFKQNGAISQLAQEITTELELDEKLKTPEDVLKMLDTSHPNNILSDVITKVGTKLHTKLTKNEIDQGDLVREAMDMMTSLQGLTSSYSTPSSPNQFPNLMQIMNFMPHMMGGGHVKAAKKGTKHGARR